ncbi:MAG: hypothetical protein OET90_06470 [Desulfuromonadales bacterium]|nr:hypothetical protein [Desulfuromonadales bacterium]
MTLKPTPRSMRQCVNAPTRQYANKESNLRRQGKHVISADDFI